MEAIPCPRCPTGSLAPFEATETLKTFVCSRCRAIVQLRLQNDAWSVLVDGAGAASGLQAVLAFFGIEDFSDLLLKLSEWFSPGAPGEGPTGPLTRKPPFEDFIRGK